LIYLKIHFRIQVAYFFHGNNIANAINIMKKIIASLLLVSVLALSSCSSLKNIGNYLSEADAANAIKEALLIGSDFGVNSLGRNGSFSRDVLVTAVLPQGAQRVLETLDRLGLAKEFDRFAATLDNAAVTTVNRSAPIFVNGIRQMSIRDAIGIVKNGGTAATDYLRRSVGSDLVVTITPVMRTALDEYHVTQEWDKLIGPIKLALGNKVSLNLDLDRILAVIVTNEMFRKIEQQEIAIRTNAQARTSASLQRVFGRDWNTTIVR
jgi:hypothetical protein